MEVRVKKLEDKVSKMDTRLAVAESNINDMKEDISDIKSNTTWLIWLNLQLLVFVELLKSRKR